MVALGIVVAIVGVGVAALLARQVSCPPRVASPERQCTAEPSLSGRRRRSNGHGGAPSQPRRRHAGVFRPRRQRDGALPRLVLQPRDVHSAPGIIVDACSQRAWRCGSSPGRSRRSRCCLHRCRFDRPRRYRLSHLQRCVPARRHQLVKPVLWSAARRSQCDPAFRVARFHGRACARHKPWRNARFSACRLANSPLPSLPLDCWAPRPKPHCCISAGRSTTRSCLFPSPYRRRPLS